MTAVGKLSTIPWNKGVSTKDIVGEKISETMRRTYNVYLNDTLIIKNLSVEGGVMAVSLRIGEEFDGKTIGRNPVNSLIHSGMPYKAQTIRKEFMNGLRIEVVEY